MKKPQRAELYRGKSVGPYGDDSDQDVVLCRLCKRELKRPAKENAHYQCRHRVKLRAMWAEQAPLGRYVAEVVWGLVK